MTRFDGTTAPPRIASQGFIPAGTRRDIFKQNRAGALAEWRHLAV